MIMSRRFVYVGFVMTAHLCVFAVQPLMAHYSQAKIKNTTGQTVNDLHIVFSHFVRGVTNDTFHTIRPVGGEHSTSWELSNGSVEKW